MNAKNHDGAREGVKENPGVISEIPGVSMRLPMSPERTVKKWWAQ